MKKSAWQKFLAKKMGPAMKKHRTHGAAIKALAKQYRKKHG